MGRSNVIIVGSVVLAPLVLGIESYALYRPHQRRTRTTEIAGSIEISAPPVEQAPPALVPAERALDPPPPPAAPMAADPPPETETVSDVQPDPSFERRRQLMLQRKGEVLRAADEQAFGIVNVPDAQRTAIRAIDNAYAHQLQETGQLPPETDLPSAGSNRNADQTRRAAIADILGADAARAFVIAERRAERRMRGQSYRPEQVRAP
jgi:hypothetical protein